MNLKVIILIAVVVLAVAYAQDSNPQKQIGGFEINIREPIALIKEKLAAVIQNFNLVNSLKLIVDIVFFCILPGLTSGRRNLDLNSNTTRELEKLARIIEFNEPQLPLLTKYDLSNYCSTPGFKIVHDYLIADEQWADLIEFFYKSGYPEVYSAIIDLYKASGCPDKLTDDLPTGPISSTENARKRTATKTNIREEVLANQPDPLPLPTCDLADIIAQIPGSGLLSVLDLIETVSYQFQTNPSLHLLFGKIQEPVKGVSFRGFRQLPTIRGIIAALHEQMIEDNIWRIVFNFIKNQIGINFYKANLADTVVSIVEFILWGTPFPVPAPLPSV